VKGRSWKVGEKEVPLGKQIMIEGIAVGLKETDVHARL
jgi:hypothetical protein